MTAIQIAHVYGAKVIAVVKDSQEAAFLRSTPCKIARLIDLSVEHLVPKVMEETANLGVDGIIENGRRNEISNLKSDLIKCLAINGHYITSTALQVSHNSVRICYEVQTICINNPILPSLAN